MKKTKLAEDDVFTIDPFDIPQGGAMAVRDDSTIAAADTKASGDILDKLLAAIKWIFLFLPGVAIFHVVAMGCALMFLYNDWSIDTAAMAFGATTAGAFLIMLGMGKLSDLKYLRVVLGVAAFAALIGIVYSILTVFLAGDFFGSFTRFTLPLTVFAGFLLKRNTDRSSNDEPAD